MSVPGHVTDPSLHTQDTDAQEALPEEPSVFNVEGRHHAHRCLHDLQDMSPSLVEEAATFKKK